MINAKIVLVQISQQRSISLKRQSQMVTKSLIKQRINKVRTQQKCMHLSDSMEVMQRMTQPHNALFIRSTRMLHSYRTLYFFLNFYIFLLLSDGKWSLPRQPKNRQSTTARQQLFCESVAATLWQQRANKFRRQQGLFACWLPSKGQYRKIWR